MTELRFHEAAVQLLPERPRFSPENQALLERQETKLGLAFPAAVREWYGLEGGDDLLRRYSNADFPNALCELGDPIPDWYGAGPRDFVKEGLLHLMNENQGVCNWAVRLEGDDPEVVIEVDSAPDEVWLPHAETFSAFIYTRIWDFSLGDFLLQAQDVPLRSADLGLLRKSFEEGPRTRSWPGRTNYRFSSPSGRILIGDNEESQANWQIAAPTEGDLESLVHGLLGLGSLKATLYASGPAAEAVLNRLR